MSDEVSATAELDSDTDAYWIKIGLDKLEVNVCIPRSEIHKLARVCDSFWDARGSLRIGRLLGSSAFWCTDPNTREVWLLAGHDDETWELALALPSNIVEQIVAAIQEENSGTS